MRASFRGRSYIHNIPQLEPLGATSAYGIPHQALSLGMMCTALYVNTRTTSTSASETTSVNPGRVQQTQMEETIVREKQVNPSSLLCNKASPYRHHRSSDPPKQLHVVSLKLTQRMKKRETRFPNFSTSGLSAETCAKCLRALMEIEFQDVPHEDFCHRKEACHGNNEFCVVLDKQ